MEFLVHYMGVVENIMRVLNCLFEYINITCA